MFNIQKHLRHVVLALGLAAASLTAAASVLSTYHISAPNTAAADIAYVDFVFSSTNGAPAAKATLTHFTGSPLAELDRMGMVSDVKGGFEIRNPGINNDLYLAVQGPFAFNLSLSADALDFASDFDNTLFSIALYDSNEQIIGDPLGALRFSLSKTGFDPISASTLLSWKEGSAADVPEPTDWLLMLTGLVLVVAITRAKGRANPRAVAEA